MDLIGGDPALNQLEGYADETHEIVINELVETWDAFDKKNYAKRILSRTFQNASHLRLERLSSIDGLQYFVKLSSLDPSYCSQLSDLNPLNCLTNLTDLSLSCCNKYSNIILNNIANLKLLDLYYCTQLNKLSLIGLTSLSKLNLAECLQLRELSLMNLTNLNWLNLSHCSQLEDISPLSGLLLAGEELLYC